MSKATTTTVSSEALASLQQERRELRDELRRYRAFVAIFDRYQLGRATWDQLEAARAAVGERGEAV